MSAARRCSCGRESSDEDDGLSFCRFCGALIPFPEQADSWVGKTVAGRFTILRPLAQGGGGRVYLAEQALGTTKRRVALKMLLPEHASNPEMVHRFMRECEMVSLIEHPNVVRIYDFGEAAEGVLYIAMELVPGSSLASAIAQEGALEPERALHAVAQICRGVAAVHDRGIVHRDLKPDNIMLVRQSDEPELVKVLDFGIAKTLAPSPETEAGGLTQMGTVMGSPPYMSPEQFLGGKIDVRTDVYALGVVAYEMFTGTLPFQADDLNGWATQHVTAEPQPFDATPAGLRVAEPLRRAILRAMAKQPAERPTSARAFLRELSEASRRIDNGAYSRPIVSAGRPVALAEADVGAPPASVPGVRGHLAPQRPCTTPPAVVVPRAPPIPSRRPHGAADIARWALLALVAVGAGSALVVAVATAGSEAPTTMRLSASPIVAGRSSSASSLGASDTPREATIADADAALPTIVLLPPGPAVVPLPFVPPPSPPRAILKLNVSACERALQVSTCEEARALQHRCPDAAGTLHQRVHDRVSQLCAAHDHPKAAAPDPSAPPLHVQRPGSMAVTTF